MNISSLSGLSPCWDGEKDCPDRHVGCAINCQKWAEFQKKKDAVYSERLKNLEKHRYSVDAVMNRKKRGLRSN